MLSCFPVVVRAFSAFRATLLVLAASIALFGSATAARAQTLIGLNFSGGISGSSWTDLSGSSAELARSDYAGVVSQRYWNNLAGTSGTNVSLVNNSNASSGLTATYSSLNTWTDRSTTWYYSSDADYSLMHGYLDFNQNAAAATVKVSGITAPIYDVYVYTNGDENARVGKYTIGSQTYWVKDSTDFTGTYVQATGIADPGSYTNASAANYMVFSGLGDSSFTLAASGVYTTDGTYRAPVNAIQIVIPKDILYWDINGNNAGATSASDHSANGTWSSSATNWSTNSTGSTATKAWVDGGVAVFSAGTDATANSTIAVSGTVGANALIFQEGNVTLNGGIVKFSDSTPDVRVVGSATATINSRITNSTTNAALTGLNKTGTGTLVLGSTANAYTGKTVINEGTLRVGTSGVIPNASAVTIASGATLDLAGHTEVIGSLAGAGQVSFGGGSLTAGGDNTSTLFSGAFSGAGNFTKTGTGTFTLGNNLALDGIFTLAGGTLALNSFDLSVTTLRITSNSIIDFGTDAASILSATNFIIDSGVILTIANWTNATDYFYVQNNLGAQGTAPLTQIVFAGFTGADTKWESFDKQVTPVPEPATYGALLIGASLAFVGLRRFRRRS